MSWFFLFAAGMFEIGWAVTLKLTNGWTNYGFLFINMLIGLAAAYCLSLSMKSIPIMTAYPIWKGLAIVGLMFWEILVDKQPVNVPRICFALLIVVGILGLKLWTVAPVPE